MSRFMIAAAAMLATALVMSPSFASEAPEIPGVPTGETEVRRAAEAMSQLAADVSELRFEDSCAFNGHYHSYTPTDRRHIYPCRRAGSFTALFDGEGVMFFRKDGDRMVKLEVVAHFPDDRRRLADIGAIREAFFPTPLEVPPGNGCPAGMEPLPGEGETRCADPRNLILWPD